MTTPIVVIGIGNRFRRDDGVGLAVAEEIARRQVADLHVVLSTGEPGGMLDAWSGARLAVIVDAADGSHPGRIRRCGIEAVARAEGLSSHSVALPQTYELGRALDRVPDRLVVFTVDAADTRQGVGLSGDVAAAVRQVIMAVMAEVSGATGYFAGGSGGASSGASCAPIVRNRVSASLL